MTRHTTYLATIVTAIALGAATVGCANRNQDDFVPVGQFATEGEGALSYVAPQDGTVYVYGGKDNRLVYSGPIKRGETLSVDPRAKSLMIDGRVISGALDTGDRHRIYLDARDGTTSVYRESSSAAGTDPDRVIVERGARSTEYRPAPQSR